MKEDEDTYMGVVESIRLMAQIHLLWWNTSFWDIKHERYTFNLVFI